LRNIKVGNILANASAELNMEINSYLDLGSFSFLYTFFHIEII
jgi:hypothetical protein